MTDRSLTSKEQATKPPYDLALPTITVQMLGDYGQEGFFEKTDKPVNGVAGVNWSQASVDFACEIVRPAVWAEIERLRAALEHLSLYVAVNGDDWVQKTAREYLNGKPAPTLSSMRPPTDETKAQGRIRLRLAKDIYDDGADHHPPGCIALKGDLVYLHSIQTAVVSHDGTGHGFVVHDGELQLPSVLETEPEPEDPHSYIGTCFGAEAHPEGCICVKCEDRRAQKSTAEDPRMEQVRSLMREHRKDRDRRSPSKKVAAVKLYREITGCGLPTAVNACNAMLDSSEKASVLRKTRYCDYDLCPHTFDPAHSNNDH